MSNYPANMFSYPQMSNYPNMIHCMNEYTLSALRQVMDAMEDDGVDFIRNLSKEENAAFYELVRTCGAFTAYANELTRLIQEYDE